MTYSKSVLIHLVLWGIKHLSCR